jgi:hypothetical protein
MYSPREIRSVTGEPALLDVLLSKNIDPCMSDLSRNPSISLEDVLEHPELNWNWYCLVAMNKNITLEDMLAHPELPWNLDGLSYKTTLEYMLAHPEVGWDMKDVSASPRISIEEMLAHPEISWDWSSVSMSSKITIDDLVAHPELPWDWECVTANEKISMADIDANPTLPWNISHIVFNPNCTLRDYVQNGLERLEVWSWLCFCRWGDITLQDVLSNPMYNWMSWYGNSFYPKVSVQDLIEHPELPWGWLVVSYSKIISLSDMVAHPELPWNWEAVQCNKLGYDRFESKRLEEERVYYELLPELMKVY